MLERERELMLCKFKLPSKWYLKLPEMSACKFSFISLPDYIIMHGIK